MLPGYSYDSLTGKVMKCESDSAGAQNLIALAGVVIVVLALGACAKLALRHGDAATLPQIECGPALQPAYDALVAFVRGLCEALLHSVDGGRLKIMWTTLQVICRSPHHDATHPTPTL